jgi:hypothetical protein
MIHSCHVGVLPCLSMCLVVQVVFTTALAQAQPAALDDEASVCGLPIRPVPTKQLRRVF